jgi:hypothetical protein
MSTVCSRFIGGVDFASGAIRDGVSSAMSSCFRDPRIIFPTKREMYQSQILSRTLVSHASETVLINAIEESDSSFVGACLERFRSFDRFSDETQAKLMTAALKSGNIDMILALRRYIVIGSNVSGVLGAMLNYMPQDEFESCFLSMCCDQRLFYLVGEMVPFVSEASFHEAVLSSIEKKDYVLSGNLLRKHSTDSTDAIVVEMTRNKNLDFLERNQFYVPFNSGLLDSLLAEELAKPELDYDIISFLIKSPRLSFSVVNRMFLQAKENRNFDLLRCICKRIIYDVGGVVTTLVDGAFEEAVRDCDVEMLTVLIDNVNVHFLGEKILSLIRAPEKSESDKKLIQDILLINNNLLLLAHLPEIFIYAIDQCPMAAFKIVEILNDFEKGGDVMYRVAFFRHMRRFLPYISSRFDFVIQDELPCILFLKLKDPGHQHFAG